MSPSLGCVASPLWHTHCNTFNLKSFVSRKHQGLHSCLWSPSYMVHLPVYLITKTGQTIHYPPPPHFLLAVVASLTWSAVWLVCRSSLNFCPSGQHMTHYIHHHDVEIVYLHLVSVFSVATICPLRFRLSWLFMWCRLCECVHMCVHVLMCVCLCVCVLKSCDSHYFAHTVSGIIYFHITLCYLCLVLPSDFSVIEHFFIPLLIFYSKDLSFSANIFCIVVFHCSWSFASLLFLNYLVSKEPPL